MNIIRKIHVLINKTRRGDPIAELNTDFLAPVFRSERKDNSELVEVEVIKQRFARHIRLCIKASLNILKRSIVDPNVKEKVSEEHQE